MLILTDQYIYNIVVTCVKAPSGKVDSTVKYISHRVYCIAKDMKILNVLTVCIRFFKIVRIDNFVIIINLKKILFPLLTLTSDKVTFPLVHADVLKLRCQLYFVSSVSLHKSTLTESLMACFSSEPIFLYKVCFLFLLLATPMMDIAQYNL